MRWRSTCCLKKHEQGVIDLLGVSVHKNNPHAAEFIDIMRAAGMAVSCRHSRSACCVTVDDCTTMPRAYAAW